jgi:3D (Asp-Asp-Asp) domain-containing protein
MTQAFNLSQLANSVNSSGQLSGSAVTGAVPSATNSTNAANLITANFTVFQSGTKLYFQYNGTNIASLDSSGNFVTLGNHTAAGTP